VVLPHRYPSLITRQQPSGGISANRDTPVLAIHGKLDPVVLPEFALSRYTLLKDNNGMVRGGPLEGRERGVQDDHSIDSTYVCIVPFEWRLKDELANHTT
jgi:predicted esterase